MTRYGIAATLAGIAALVLGLVLDWPAFDLLGLGLLVVVLLGLLVVTRPSRLSVDREIQPPRVPKGAPAIAFLTFTNRGRRAVPASYAVQDFGGMQVRTPIPRLRRGERGTRAYRLPTTRRGIFDVEPVEFGRRDPFELFRRSRRYGHVERIWVYPRVLSLRRLPVGQVRDLEGPNADHSPQGTVTFHRLREYTPGDDLRMVHWRSSARAGQLLVRHNVDTSQPDTVVALDLRPGLYTEQTFEDAVDVAASVVVSAAAGKAPVELRLTDGAVLGGARTREATPLIDHLTGVTADPGGSLHELLLALRRSRGGTSLVVVTGELDVADLPDVVALRRRFGRLVVISVDAQPRTPITYPGVRVIIAPDADSVRSAWNLTASA